MKQAIPDVINSFKWDRYFTLLRILYSKDTYLTIAQSLSSKIAWNKRNQDDLYGFCYPLVCIFYLPQRHNEVRWLWVTRRWEFTQAVGIKCFHWRIWIKAGLRHSISSSFEEIVPQSHIKNQSIDVVDWQIESELTKMGTWQNYS